MRKVAVLQGTRRKNLRPSKAREGDAPVRVFRMPSAPGRLERAKELLAELEGTPIPGFVLEKPPARYLVIESEEFGVPLRAHQADSLRKIAEFLESGSCEADITEIHDLDTGEILRPYFQRVYRVPRIYRGEIIAYQSTPDAH